MARKSRRAVIALWTALALGVGSPPGKAQGPAASPSVSARAAVLIDARTGAILYAKRAFLQMDPASITKVMTAIVTLRHGHLDRMVTISQAAAAVPGSRMHLRAGQRYTVRDLLRGLLLRSGNDAAVALAQAVAGSVPRFVAEMNVTAQELGAFNTSFANPHGLTAPGHWTTAYDLARIAAYAMTLPTFRELVGSRTLEITEYSQGTTRSVHNTNLLLSVFPGADGIKTGTTAAAGKCLAASATHHGRRLIAVVLNSQNRWQDAVTLLQWGFSHSETMPAIVAGQAMGPGPVPVVHGTAPAVSAVAQATVWVTVPRGASFYVTTVLPRAVTAPVRRGQLLGRSVVWVRGEPMGATALEAARAIPRRSAGLRVWQWLLGWVRFFDYGDGGH